MKQRGRPSRRTSERLTKAELEKFREEVEKDFPGLGVDSGARDFRPPMPPWDDKQERFNLLNLLRVQCDPTNAIPLSENCAIIGALIPDTPTDDSGNFELVVHYCGEWLTGLLAFSAETVADNLNQLKKLVENRDQNKKHEAVLTLEGYIDFVRENGFEPSPAKLRKHLEGKHGKRFSTQSMDRDKWLDTRRQAGVA